MPNDAKWNDVATSDLFDVRGEVALVTGASSGIGEAVARGLADLGATVGCFARDTDRLQGVVRDITDVGGHALACPGDVRARGTLEDAVRSLETATIANRGLHQAHYNASKAALVQLGRSLAWEWGHRGVRVNTVSPGYTDTPMARRPEQVEKMIGYAADTPLQRNAEPAEIVGPVVFLLSRAASFVTGVDLLVDGGHTIW